MQKDCTVQKDVCISEQTNNKMKVYCKICGVPLTGELKEYPGKVNARPGDEKCFINKGQYQVCDGSWGYTLFSSGLCEEEKGCIVIHVEDLINAMDLTNTARLSGCCGMDGLVGPNKLCINGHEIATEHSDCWQPWAVVFKKEAVLIK